nr:hypothetical protein [Ktedonobacter robiniae]
MTGSVCGISGADKKLVLSRRQRKAGCPETPDPAIRLFPDRRRYPGGSSINRKLDALDWRLLH